MKSFEPFRLDVVRQSLWRSETRVPLMPKPFAVLRYLVDNPGRLVTHDELIAAVWPDTHVQPEILRRYILEIRRALHDHADAPRYIRTFPKRGYEFIAPVTNEMVSGVADNSTSATPRLVGRVSALAELERHLEGALAGRRQMVFVVGEPGIGKTSLVDAFQQRAASNPQVRVARGQSVEGFGTKEAYYPILEALGQLIRGRGGTAIVSTLARHAPTWMIQFASLVRADQHAALQRELLGATRERMVRELCEALEVMTQTVALVLVLEDLHWVDHSTLDLISAIARRRGPARLLVVGTFRPADVILSDSPLKTLKHDLMLHRLSHEVALERLQESDVGDYLATAFVPSDFPRGLATTIHTHSDGNPLFMTAMLDHLVQQGVLSRTDGRWRVAVPLERVDPGVPETLRQMLELQLQHLTKSEQDLLKCASVAGQHFTAWSVARMADRDLADVEEKCQALAEGQQFLKSSGARELFDGALTLEYEFRHSLYREVLYRDLSPTERASLHRRLAEGLERLRSPVEPEMAAEIALHCEEGREYERAVRYLLLAGENATRRHAYRESLDVLEHARRLLPHVAGDRGRRLDLQLLERIGDAHYTLGDVQRSLETYDVMAHAAAAAGFPAAEAKALMRLPHPAAFADPDRSVAACERAAAIGAASGNPLLETHARLLASCWRIMIDGWRREDAQASADAIACLRRLGGDLPPYDQILYARVQVLQSEYADACVNADQALSKLTAAHGLWVRAKTLSTKSNALLFCGRLGEAHQTVTEGIALAKKNENAPWVGILLSTLAWLRWETFDFDGVRALAADVEQSGVITPGLQVQLRAPTNVARSMMLVLQGFTDLAEGHADRARRCFEDLCDQPAQPKFAMAWHRRLFARLGLAETWLASGDPARSTAEADALAADISAGGDNYLKAKVWELSTRLALTSGQRDRAEQCLVRALEAVTSCDVPLAAWRVHATARNVYRASDKCTAETHRARAQAIILQLARSLDSVESLRRSLLAAPLVRGVLDDAATDAISAGLVMKS